MATVVIPTSAPAALPVPPRVAAPAGLWPHWLQTVMRGVAERDELSSLDHRELRDIGLTPTDAAALARKPLWRS